MGKDDPNREAVDLRCPSCACPMSRVIKARRLTVSGCVASGRKASVVIRQQRECAHCNKTFFKTVPDDKE